jgi:hypothetical protein
MIPVFERAKIFYALDGATTVNDPTPIWFNENHSPLDSLNRDFTVYRLKFKIIYLTLDTTNKRPVCWASLIAA